MRNAGMAGFVLTPLLRPQRSAPGNVTRIGGGRLYAFADAHAAALTPAEADFRAASGNSNEAERDETGAGRRLLERHSGRGIAAIRPRYIE